MRLETLMERTAADEAPEYREAKVEAVGGAVTFQYKPVPPPQFREPPLSTDELLERHLVGWNVKEDDEHIAPLNADTIRAMKPEVKDAFRDAILGRKKPADKAEKPEKPADKPVEATHGSFEPVAEKETPRGSK